MRETVAHARISYQSENRSKATIPRDPNGYLQIAISQPASVTEPAPQKDGLSPRASRFLPLSGKSDVALRESAGRYLAWLDEDADAALLADMAWTATTGRSHFGHRAGVVLHDADTLRTGLAALAEGGEQPARRTGAAPRCLT